MRKISGNNPTYPLPANCSESRRLFFIALSPNVDGAYIARTDSEASLSIEQVCAALKNRGGFSSDYKDLLENIKQFFEEAAYQLCACLLV